MIYIVTNRKVDTRREGDRLIETIRNDGRERALPVFRIATVELDARDPKKDKVELVPDEFVESYDDMAPDVPLDRVFGTRRMFLDLYRRMSEARGRKGDTLSVIHGFQYTFEATLEHVRKLHDVYIRPSDSSIAHLVYFSWPSCGSLTDYRDDQVDAIESGKLLGRLFRKTRQFFAEFFGNKEEPRNEFCGYRIHLAAHSMGGQVLQYMINDMNNYPADPFSLFGEVLLLNADADWNLLEPGRALHRLHEYCERTHIYNNYSDDALWISQHTKNFVKRLGRHGPSDLDTLPPRTIVVDCSDLRIKGTKTELISRKDPFAARTAEITGQKVPTRERLLDHWGYLYRPEVIADIKAVLAQTSSSAISGRTPTLKANLFKLKN
jgi:esterase/lipase superfamily enzyme